MALQYKFNPFTGTLDIIDPAGSVAGSDKQVQYNDGGVAAGIDGLSWHKTINKLKVGKSTTTTPAELLDISGNLNFDPVIEPTSGEVSGMSLVENVSSGTLAAGTYYYNVVYGTDEGNCGSFVSAGLQPSITISSNSSITINNIPISSDPRVTNRKIMRTFPGGSFESAYLLDTINDNTTTTYVDDGSRSLDQNLTTYRNPNTTAGTIKIAGDKAIQVYQFNTGIGVNALAANTAGNSMVAVGTGALGSNTTGGENTAVGYLSMNLCINNVSSVGVGYATLYNTPSAVNNVAIGHSAMRNLSGASPSYNVGIGNLSLWDLQNGDNFNLAIGYASGYNFSGLGNVSLGATTGYMASVSGGSYNVFIGYQVQYNQTLSSADNNIMIGKQLNLPTTSTSNHLNIGNLLKGDLGTTTKYLSIEGGSKKNIRTISSNDNVLVTDSTILLNGSGSAVRATLPSAVTYSGHIFTIKSIDATNTTDIDSAAGNIDGNATKTLALNEVVQVQSDGSNWYIISN